MRVRDAGYGVRRAEGGVRGAECGVRSAVNAHVGGTENDRIRTRAVSQADGRAKSGHRTQSTPSIGRKMHRKPVGNHTGCRAEDVSGTGREAHRPSSGNAGRKTRRAPDGRLYEHKAANRNRHRTQAERIAHRTSCGRHTDRQAKGGTDTERYSQQAPDAKHTGHRAEETPGSGREALQATRCRCPRDDNQEGTSTRKAQRMSPEIHSGCDN